MRPLRLQNRTVTATLKQMAAQATRAAGGQQHQQQPRPPLLPLYLTRAAAASSLFTSRLLLRLLLGCVAALFLLLLLASAAAAAISAVTSAACSSIDASASASPWWRSLPSLRLLSSPASAAASAVAEGPGDAELGDDVRLSSSFASSCPSPSVCPLHGLRHLVLVAGHAVLTSLDFHNLTDSASWYLQRFQVGQLSAFLQHIESGIALAAADPHSLLLFSGGETRVQAGPRSEAQSYWLVAELQRWWGHNDGKREWTEDGQEAASPSSLPSSSSSSPQADWSVRSRASTEEFARDSYENLLFSICRFHELTQAYPQLISVVGFSFKQRRFTELHRAALRFPSARFRYIGVDPLSNESRAEAEAGERVNSFLPFSSDPYGCRPPLSVKRLSRNPFRRSHGYGHQSSCPQLSRLIHHCDTAPFPQHSRLPWDHDSDTEQAPA